MKILFIILGAILLALILLVIGYSYRLGKPVNESLSDGYYFHSWKKKIIFSPMGNWFELGYFEMDADPTAFVVLSRYFGKDNRAVYWQGRRTQADPLSFVVDSNSVPKDKAHVYFPVESPNSLFVVEGADPATYQPLPILNDRYYHYWYADATSIFLDGKKVDADRATFVRLSASLATDASYIYSIEPADTLEVGKPGATQLVRRGQRPAGEVAVISENYARLGHSIAHSGWKNRFALLAFENINSIRIVDERNIIVDGILVSDGKKIEGIDEASLEIIDRDFFKDKNSVYYNTEKIPLANPTSFEEVYEEYSKDNQQVFYKREVLKGANPTTFTYNYASGIATDGKLSFKAGQLVTPEK